MYMKYIKFQHQPQQYRTSIQTRLCCYQGGWLLLRRPFDFWDFAHTIQIDFNVGGDCGEALLI